MKKPRNELKDLKQFGLTLGIILFVFGVIHFFKGRAIWYIPFFLISVLSICAALVMPVSLKKPYSVFMKIAHALGWFNTRVILIAVYFFLLTPIALIIRMLGKDPLNRKIDKKEPTYWSDRMVTKAMKEQLEKQF